MACRQENQATPDTNSDHLKAESLINNSKVTLELSIPSNDAGRTLFLNCENNEVSVILRNNSDSAVRFYETTNSWGYQNYTFIIKTKDTTYQLTKAGGGFFKNVPFYHTIFPRETLVLNFNLKDTKCDLLLNETGQLKRKILRGGEDGWQGLPDKPIVDATIQVIYKLSNDHIDFKPFGATIYSDSLLSKVLKISVDK